TTADPSDTPDPLEVIDRAASALADAEAELEREQASAAPYLRLRRDEESHSDPSRNDGVPASAGMSPAERPDTPAPDRSQPLSVLVEGVMLGNLPGFGGAWLTQYAGLLAQQDGPVAIVHVGDDSLDLELILPF